MSATYVSACVTLDWPEIFASRSGPVMLSRIDLAEFVHRIESFDQGSRQLGAAWRKGLAVDYGSRGQVGATVLGARSLGAALHRLCEFFPLVQDATSLQLESDEQWTTLSYRILDPGIWPRHTDAIYSLGVFAAMLRAAAPCIWNHADITIEAEPGAIRCDLSRIVGANVVYGGPANMLRFPTAALRCPIEPEREDRPHAVQALTRDLIRKRRNIPLADRAKLVIYREINERCVSQDYVARELGMSSRTLRRKLAAQNLSYQTILDECRMQLAALEFRSRHNLSLSEVALKLGYSEHSTFSRAFARWAGMAPQEYRRSVASCAGPVRGTAYMQAAN